ncbi:DUF456 domain-containing protein [Paludifilum halophilum]|nr:DUF456 family protein [Paludifilum halophilum]
MEIIWWLIIVLLFIAGFAGLLLPVLPDSPLMLLGFVLYHFLIDSDSLTLSFWIGAVLITAAVLAIDYIAGGIAARTYGGSRWSIGAAMIGALVGGIVFPPLGILFGPILAVMIVELLQKKSWEEALKTGFGTLVGFLGGLFVKGLLMIGMIVWFILLAI